MVPSGDPDDEIDDLERDEVESEEGPSLSDGLQGLPLLDDDIYLRLQAFNLGIVDSILNDWERGLLAEYHEKETTPTSTALVVAAVGQLWVFGLYELLRTWRQRARELVTFADTFEDLPPEDRKWRIEEQKARVREVSADPARPNPAHVIAFERVASDAAFLRSLRDALDRSGLPFRKLESLRVHLAKHEIPKVKGSYGLAPGYSRIDEISQSICWEVPLGEMEVEIISRRSLADRCRKFGTDVSAVILPKAIQKALEPIPAQSYGVKRVIMVLADGAEHEAFVAWNRQILKVVGMPLVVIDPGRVVGVRAAPDQPVA